MGKSEYRETIIRLLTGEAVTFPGYRHPPTPERLDWHGISEVEALFHQTAGGDRLLLIEAIGDILERDTRPVVISALLHLVTVLDLAQLDDHVRHLERLPSGEDPAIRRELDNYIGTRSLREHPPAFDFKPPALLR